MLSKDDDPIWGTLDAACAELSDGTSMGEFRATLAYNGFCEADAYLGDMKNPNASWKFLLNGSFETFIENFGTYTLFTIGGVIGINVTGAQYMVRYLSEEGRIAAISLLSTIYSELPFIEMKKEGYDYCVRYCGF